jgi:hypothetical protein
MEDWTHEMIARSPKLWRVTDVTKFCYLTGISIKLVYIFSLFQQEKIKAEQLWQHFVIMTKQTVLHKLLSLL